MITGLRGVVLIELDDAVHLVKMFDLLNDRGMSSSGTLAGVESGLRKACADASATPRDTHAHVREVGAQQDSAHYAMYDLVDTAGAARILGCGEANVRDLRRRGRLPGHRAGRGWVYPAAAVVARAEKRAARRG